MVPGAVDNRESLTVGIDLGGTKMEAVVVDRTGSMRGNRRWPTEALRGPEAVVADVARSVREAVKIVPNGKLQQVGVGVAGQVDPSTGLVRYAPNLKWHDVPLGAQLQQELQVPVHVLNDVQAATYGEWRYGAARGKTDVVCIFVGTGVGGGLIAGGRLLRGTSGSAGEIGHLIVDIKGSTCSCHNRGCLEAVASGWAIARRAREAVAADEQLGAGLLALAEEEAADLSAAGVARAFHGGNELARRLMEETAQYLGAGVASVVNVFNPSLLVLGGGVVEGVPELVAMVREEARTRSLTAPWGFVHITQAELGGRAGAIGAAAAARDFSR